MSDASIVGDVQERVTIEPLDLLIFAAHPDDAEIGMGGTIYKHTQAGRRVGICDLTRAEMSSNGTVEQRQQEADEASRILGIHYRSNLGLPDRGFGQQPDTISRIVTEIRRTRPRIVFAPYVQDRHPDHISCGLLVKEALFNAKLRKYQAEERPHLVTQFYHYFVNDVAVGSDLLVNISSVQPIKMEALRAYRSQFELTPGAVQTPLNQGYLERVEARDKMLGQQHMVAFAEGFMGVSPFGVELF